MQELSSELNLAVRKFINGREVTVYYWKTVQETMNFLQLRVAQQDKATLSFRALVGASLERQFHLKKTCEHCAVLADHDCSGNWLFPPEQKILIIQIGQIQDIGQRLGNTYHKISNTNSH